MSGESRVILDAFIEGDQEVQKLRGERDALITALRECVVALESFPELTEHDDLAKTLQRKEDQRKQAQDHAKSVLERYK